MKMYNVHMYHCNPKTGVKTGGYNHGKKRNASPMNHKQAIKFKWAIDMYDKGIVYELVEVDQASID